MILNIVATVAASLLILISIAHKLIDPNFQAPLYQYVLFFIIPWVVVIYTIWK